MPNELDRGYFGIRLGDALSQGAGHIAGALEKRYSLQRQNKLLEEERKRSGQDLTLKAASMGITLDPNNPEANDSAFQEFAKQMKAKRDAELGTEQARTGLIREQQKALSNKPIPATKGQEAIDRNFAKEYADYSLGGGFADATKQIRVLDRSLQQLKSDKDLSGPVIGSLPDGVRKRLYPNSIQVQQAIENSVQATLRQTLGAQFTEKEGKLFLERGYDPALEEKYNVVKLSDMLNSLKTMANAKASAMKYFEENGTMRGYSGKLYTIENGEVKETSADNLMTMGESASPKQDIGTNEVMRRNKATGEVGVFDRTTGKRIR